MTKTSSKPKYQIGDSVFYLENNRLESREVTGIFKLSNDFKYCFDTHQIESYGWYNEDKIFFSVENLMESLKVDYQEGKKNRYESRLKTFNRKHCLVWILGCGYTIL